jgi:predicted phosphodiesterase
LVKELGKVAYYATLFNEQQRVKIANDMITLVAKFEDEQKAKNYEIAHRSAEQIYDDLLNVDENGFAHIDNGVQKFKMRFTMPPEDKTKMQQLPSVKEQMKNGQPPLQSLVAGFYRPEDVFDYARHGAITSANYEKENYLNSIKDEITRRLPDERYKFTNLDGKTHYIFPTDDLQNNTEEAKTVPSAELLARNYGHGESLDAADGGGIGTGWWIPDSDLYARMGMINRKDFQLGEREPIRPAEPPKRVIKVEPEDPSESKPEAKAGVTLTAEQQVKFDQLKQQLFGEVDEIVDKVDLNGAYDLIHQVKESELAKRQTGYQKLKGKVTLQDITNSEYGKERISGGRLDYIPMGGKIAVIGDTHGRSKAMEKALEKTGFLEAMARGENMTLVILGDYVDRGDSQLRNVLLATKLKQMFGDRVVLLQGNHDSNKLDAEHDGGDLEGNIEEMRMTETGAETAVDFDAIIGRIDKRVDNGESYGLLWRLSYNIWYDHSKTYLENQSLFDDFCEKYKKHDGQLLGKLRKNGWVLPGDAGYDLLLQTQTAENKKVVNEFFDFADHAMSLAAVSASGIMLVHGGVSREVTSLDQIAKIYDVDNLTKKLVWNDTISYGRHTAFEQALDESTVKDILKHLDLTTIVSGHIHEDLDKDYASTTSSFGGNSVLILDNSLPIVQFTPQNRQRITHEKSRL